MSELTPKTHMKIPNKYYCMTIFCSEAKADTIHVSIRLSTLDCKTTEFTLDKVMCSSAKKKLSQ